MQLNKVASSSGKVEQIFPGMLKNRGSNIRKMADEIQQSEGRRKYLGTIFYLFLLYKLIIKNLSIHSWKI